MPNYEVHLDNGSVIDINAEDVDIVGRVWKKRYAFRDSDGDDVAFVPYRHLSALVARPENR